MSSRPSGTEVVDADGAVLQLRGDVEGYVEICRIFLEEARTWQTRLPVLAERDRAGFVAMLHELTNALPIVGAGALARSLRQMEFELREDAGQLAETALQAALQGMDDVCAALEVQIASRSG